MTDDNTIIPPIANTALDPFTGAVKMPQYPKDPEPIRCYNPLPSGEIEQTVGKIDHALSALEAKLDKFKTDTVEMIETHKASTNIRFEHFNKLLNQTSAVLSEVRSNIESTLEELHEKDTKFLSFIKNINVNHIMLIINIIMMFSIIYLIIKYL